MLNHEYIMQFHSSVEGENLRNNITHSQTIGYTIMRGECDNAHGTRINFIAWPRVTSMTFVCLSHGGFSVWEPCCYLPTRRDGSTCLFYNGDTGNVWQSPLKYARSDMLPSKIKSKKSVMIRDFMRKSVSFRYAHHRRNTSPTDVGRRYEISMPWRAQSP